MSRRYQKLEGDEWSNVSYMPLRGQTAATKKLLDYDNNTKSDNKINYAIPSDEQSEGDKINSQGSIVLLGSWKSLDKAQIIANRTKFSQWIIAAFRTAANASSSSTNALLTPNASDVTNASFSENILLVDSGGRKEYLHVPKKTVILHVIYQIVHGTNWCLLLRNGCDIYSLKIYEPLPSEAAYDQIEKLVKCS